MFKTLATATVLAACMAMAASAEDMVFTSWGGTTQDAQAASWAAPFTEKTGVNVRQDGPTDYGKLKAMVESGNVDWDVVDVEYDFAIAAAKIDATKTPNVAPSSRSAEIRAARVNGGQATSRVGAGETEATPSKSHFSHVTVEKDGASFQVSRTRS